MLNSSVKHHSPDPLDEMIRKEGLRIISVALVKVPKQRWILAILNNQEFLKLNITNYPKLNDATDEQIKHWKLIGDGIGIQWPDLDEDISLKGLLMEVAQKNLIKLFSTKSGS